MAQKELEIDRDFETRNWLGLVRLSQMGYDKKESIRIMRDIEEGN